MHKIKTLVSRNTIFSDYRQKEMSTTTIKTFEFSFNLRVQREATLDKIWQTNNLFVIFHFPFFDTSRYIVKFEFLIRTAK